MTIKKIKGISESVELRQSVQASINKNILTLNENSKTLNRKIDLKIEIILENNKIILNTKKGSKNERRIIGTTIGHIKNMLAGLEKEFEYELEICNVHFPITVTYDKTKNQFIIKNLLGEKCPRVVNAISPERINVEIKAPIIKIKSYDLEAAGQNAANLEKISKIKYRDRNKFQDGIFITKKPGKVFI